MATISQIELSKTGPALIERFISHIREILIQLN